MEFSIDEMNLLVEGKPIGPTVCGFTGEAEYDTCHEQWIVERLYMETEVPAVRAYCFKTGEVVVVSPAVHSVVRIDDDPAFSLLLTAAEHWVDENLTYETDTPHVSAIARHEQAMGDINRFV